MEFLKYLFTLYNEPIKLGTCLAVLCLSAPSWAQDINYLNQLDYVVGTTHIQLNDLSREETWAPYLTDVRKLMLQLW
jgi:hypothetical protein